MGIRSDLANALSEALGTDGFEYIKHQKGMFSLLPLQSSQIKSLKNDSSIYMAPDGRVNICGFTSAEKIAYFAEQVKGVM